MNADQAILPAAPIAGRIQGYRNSSPRRVKLFGLGDAGAKAVGLVALRGLPNVEVTTFATPVGWEEVAGDAPDPDTNMIVIVCAEGDERLFRPHYGRPDVLVTFVLLQTTGNLLVVRDEGVNNARVFSDLFVTTSDADYVSDLVDNLAA
jgi:hypothetical protein